MLQYIFFSLKKESNCWPGFPFPSCRPPSAVQSTHTSEILYTKDLECMCLCLHWYHHKTEIQAIKINQNHNADFIFPNWESFSINFQLNQLKRPYHIPQTWLGDLMKNGRGMGASPFVGQSSSAMSDKLSLKPPPWSITPSDMNLHSHHWSYLEDHLTEKNKT